MKKTSQILTCLVITASTLQADEGFQFLFNKANLENWQAARATEAKPTGDFTVNKEHNAIEVYHGAKNGSKQASDCLVSNKEFSNFILKLQYKWTGPRYAPRTIWDRDAGLLFHVHGDLKKVWPNSLEMQIGESPGDKPNNWKGKDTEKRFHTGDLFVLGNLKTTTKLAAKKNIYDTNGKAKVGKHVLTELGKEKPQGEWNQMEIRVLNSKKASFWMNGEKVLETSDFKAFDSNGEAKPLAKGHIGLQAEWAGILYRNIMIKEYSETELEKLMLSK